MAFHTQGKEFYWGYEGLEPPESRVIATEFERVSGYRGIQYIDSHAGYKRLVYTRISKTRVYD